MQGSLLTYVHRDSIFHQMDARWKLVSIVLCAAAVATLHTVPAAGLALLEAVLLLGLSRLPWSWFLSRLAGVALFLSLFLILMPLTLPGDDFWIGPIPLSRHGLAMGMLVVCKALAIVALALLLAASEPLERTLKAAHWLHVPGLLVQLLMLTYRYLLLFSDEWHKLRIALRLRRYRNRVNAHSYRTLGHVTGTLLVRSYERAERVANAMRCRGFDGQYRLLHQFQTRASDVLLAVAMVLFLGLVPVVLDWGLSPGTGGLAGEAAHSEKTDSSLNGKPAGANTN